MQSKQTLLGIAVALALTEMAMAEDATVLNEVVVTAPAMLEPLTVVTDPKAPRQPVPAHDGADYLKNIPGFSVIRKGGTDGDPVLRGFGGSRLNVLLDGEYILGGCGGRMDPPTAYAFPEAYDRVTVLKGPQSVTHGGGNLAGTALFERTAPRFEQPGVRGFVGALAGSFRRNDQVVDLTGGGPQGFFRTSVTRSDSGNYRDGDGREVHSAYNRWSTGLTGGWTPDKDTRVELDVERSNGEARYADRMMDGVAFDRTSVGATFVKEHLSPLVDKVEAKVYRNYVDHVMDNYSLRSKPAMAPFQVNNPDRLTHGARASSRLALAERSTFTFGVDYQENEHTTRTASNATMAPDIGSLSRTPDYTFKNVGVFGEAEYGFNDKNRLVGGLRLDQLDVDDEKTRRSDEDRMRGYFLRHERAHSHAFTTFIGVGHAERAADFWERSTFNGFDLAPEKSNQLDTGLVYASESVRASLSLFYAKINDYILTFAGATKSASNIDATTYGSEADFSYAFATAWKATATLAYVHGENDTQNVPLAQMPPLEGRLGLSYDNKTWSVGALMRAAADQDRVHVGYGNIAGQDIGATEGFTVFSLNGGYRLTKQTLVTAGIDNVTDKTYAEHLSRGGFAVSGLEQTTRVNEPGRNIWLKANVSF